MEKIWTNIEMPRGRKLNFEVDKLTRSIEHRITGESVHTQVVKTDKSDSRQIGKKSNWSFSWKHEKTLANRTVYKLVTVNETQFIQGLISLEIREGHVYMHLLESAGHNRGNDKKYLGVAGNLVAFACKLSFDLFFTKG